MAKSKKDSFPKIMILDGQEIFDQGKIANCFYKFFVDIGLKLSPMLPESQTKYYQYLNSHQTSRSGTNLTDVEIKEVLRSLKPSKSLDSIFSNGIIIFFWMW